MKLSHQSYLIIFNNEENAYNAMFKYIFAYTQTYMLMMAYIDIHWDSKEFFFCS